MEGRKRKEGRKEGRKERRKATENTIRANPGPFHVKGEKEEGSARNHISYILMSSSHTTCVGSWYEEKFRAGRLSHGRLRSWKDLAGPTRERLEDELGVLHVDADGANDHD